MTRQSVTNLEVARYYLKNEFSHLMDGFNRNEVFDNEIDNLPEGETWNLGEALSIYYRLNSVWWVIANPKWAWTLEKVPVKDVHLTGMGDGTSMTKLIYSDQVKNNPLKLKSYLKEYNARQSDDPENYGLRRSKKIKMPRVFMVEYDDKKRMLDGSNRLIQHLLNGANFVEAYVARPLGESSDIVPTAGPGVFRLLQKLFNSGNEDQKQAVKSVAVQLSENTGIKNPIIEDTKSRPGEENG